MEEKIPKILHYCWFGKKKKSDLIEKCLESWRIHCPTFQIKEWTEENFDIEAYPFTKKMYEQKKWAFVSDFARLIILEKEGGFYLDTDMLLLKPLDIFTKNSCILGEEKDGVISAGIIGATPNHPYIKKAINHYTHMDYANKLRTIPRVLTEIYSSYEDKETLTVYPSSYFYPFDQFTIASFKGEDLGENVYGVHLWNYSWGHPLNKFFKKIGIYRFGVMIVQLLGIKNLLKKLFGFI